MDSVLLFDVLTALEALGHHHGDNLFQGKWEHIHWMSTPGPIYCGDTDNCGTGPFDAPNNVDLDEDSFQVLYRQPVNYYELRQVINAADADPFRGYGADGNLYWSYESVKGWWTEPRRKIVQEIKRLREIQRAKGDWMIYAGLQRWLSYYEDGLYQYLQAYAFSLDTGRFPQTNDKLPDL